jgi:hypothetical protein
MSLTLEVTEKEAVSTASGVVTRRGMDGANREEGGMYHNEEERKAGKVGTRIHTSARNGR